MKGRRVVGVFIAVLGAIALLMVGFAVWANIVMADALDADADADDLATTDDEVTRDRIVEAVTEFFAKPAS